MIRLFVLLSILPIAGCALIGAGISIGFLFAVAEHRIEHAHLWGLTR